eukprot:775708-Lingulodinium_polyedra.AAC.1
MHSSSDHAPNPNAANPVLKTIADRAVRPHAQTLASAHGNPAESAMHNCGESRADRLPPTK